MNMPLVSVIVPIYNVEDYLQTCCNSILSQSFNNIEVILVNAALRMDLAKLLNK